MFGTQDARFPPVGYLYEFDCKPITTAAGLGNDWIAVMNVHQVRTREVIGIIMQISAFHQEFLKIGKT